MRVFNAYMTGMAYNSGQHAYSEHERAQSNLALNPPPGHQAHSAPYCALLLATRCDPRLLAEGIPDCVLLLLAAPPALGLRWIALALQATLRAFRLCCSLQHSLMLSTA